jgi:hypothetical protein
MSSRPSIHPSDNLVWARTKVPVTGSCGLIGTHFRRRHLARRGQVDEFAGAFMLDSVNP